MLRQFAPVNRLELHLRVKFAYEYKKRNSRVDGDTDDFIVLQVSSTDG